MMIMSYNIIACNILLLLVRVSW